MSRAGRAASNGARLSGLACALALLAGCSDRSEREERAPAAPAPFVSAARQARSGEAADLTQESGPKLAYRHDLTLGLAPARVAPHFAAARDRCLKDAAACTLLQSSIREGAGATRQPQAMVQVRLTHAAVAPFVAAVTAPLPGEAPGDVVVQDQSTRAEDLTRALADTGRRLTQLKDYRDRLTALAEKPDNRAEDLIRIAGELSRVQGQIEDVEGRRLSLDERVDTEIVTVNFQATQAQAGAFAPVQEVWARSGPILGESAASALRFTVVSLPWLPVAGIALLLLRLAWRLRRKRTTPAPARSAP